MIIDFLSNKKITEATEKSWWESLKDRIADIADIDCFDKGTRFYKAFVASFSNDSSLKHLEKRFDYWWDQTHDDEQKLPAPSKLVPFIRFLNYAVPYKSQYKKRIKIDKKNNKFTLYIAWFSFTLDVVTKPGSWFDTRYFTQNRNRKLSNGIPYSLQRASITTELAHDISLPLPPMDPDDASFDEWFAKQLHDAVLREIPLDELYSIYQETLDNYFLDYLDEKSLEKESNIDEAYNDTYKDHDNFKNRIIKTIMNATGYINDRYDIWGHSKGIPYYAKQFSNSPYLKKIRDRIQYWDDRITKPDTLILTATDYDVKLMFGKDDIDKHEPMTAAAISDRVTFNKDSIDIVLDKVKILFAEHCKDTASRIYLGKERFEENFVKEGKVSNNASYIFNGSVHKGITVSSLPLKLEWPPHLFALDDWFKKALDKALCEQFPWNEIYPLFCDYLDEGFLEKVDE